MTSAATVWHSSYSPVAEQIMASDQDRKQFLEMYAKMNPSDAAAEEMNNKLKWDIIRKYHEPISKLTQVKTGKYAGQWHTYMKGVDGTAPRQYKRFKTFDDAYQFIVSYYSVQSLTLESYFPHWLEWKCRYHNNKAATKEHNQNAFKKFLLGTKLARIPITQITTDDIDEWCREVLIEYPLNASRFNTYRIVVKGPLELACKENLISTNPWQSERMDYKQFLKSKRRAPSGKKIFYDDEIRQIVNNCLESYAINRNSANIAVIVNFDLGLRVSELSALKWSDIDWKNNTVFIQRQESMRVVEDYVKSDSAGGYRELPLSSQAASLLKKLQKDFGPVSEYIFCDADGRRKTSASIQKRLIYAQVGKNGDTATGEIKRIHCQRRTVGTRIANNMGIEAARVWLGHTDIQTTLRYVYSTETVESMRKFVENSSFLPSDCQMGEKIVNPADF